VEQELISAAEASSAARVTTNWIYQLVAAGRIPAIRVGRAVLIRRREWEDWLDKRQGHSALRKTDPGER
jgi:excisionase family DNA binding protein